MKSQKPTLTAEFEMWNEAFKQGQLSKEEEIYDIFKRNGYKNMKAWLKQQIQGGKE